MILVRQAAIAAMVLLCGGVAGSSHAIAAGEQNCPLADAAWRKDVAARVRDAGYAYVTVDLEGFRSGSMNEVL